MSKCTVTGRGIQPHGLRVNEPAELRVNTLNASEADLAVTVSVTAPAAAAATALPVKVAKVGIFCVSDMSFMYYKCTKGNTQ